MVTVNEDGESGWPTWYVTTRQSVTMVRTPPSSVAENSGSGNRRVNTAMVARSSKTGGLSGLCVKENACTRD